MNLSKEAVTGIMDLPEGGGFIKMPPVNDLLFRSRVKAELRQEDLADLCGLTVGSISHYELLLTYPKYENGVRIAEVLGTNHESIFPEWGREFIQNYQAPTAEDNESEVKNAGLLRGERLPAADVRPEEIVVWKEDVEVLTAALAHVDYRQQMIMIARSKGVEFSELGKEWGITPERVRQIEAQAVRKLRSAVRDMGLEYHPSGKVVTTTALSNGLVNAFYEQDWDRALKLADGLQKGIIQEQSLAFHLSAPKGIKDLMADPDIHTWTYLDFVRFVKGHTNGNF